MGCFDVACGISGMTIKADENALLLFIIPHSDYPSSTGTLKGTVELKAGVQQVFNEGPLGMYMPFCLPIRGKYNDYGSLEDVVKDETVQALELYFSMTITDLISIIYRNEYGKIHDEEILKAYSNGLKVSFYSDDKVTEEWLIEAGFTKRDDNTFVYKDTPNLKKWDGKSWNDTGIPVNHVEFKKVEKKGDSRDGKIMPHIIYYKSQGLNKDYEKLEYYWLNNTSEFCEQFYRLSSDKLFGVLENGIALGIKKEFLTKILLIRKMSAMFIDGNFYDQLTDEVNTNEYYIENGGILDCYPNRFMMDKMGFIHVGEINDDTLEKMEDNGCSISYRSHHNMQYLYIHPSAPNHKFGVRIERSMCIYFYKIDGDKLVKIEERQGSPFSATGCADIFENLTGNKLDLSELSKVKRIDLTFFSIQDVIKRQEKNLSRSKNLEAELSKFDKDDKSEERTNIVMELMSIRHPSETRECEKESLGDFNFPLVYKLYLKNFLSPSAKFTKECERFTNFITSLWGINKPLMPSSHFGQHGEYQNQLALNNIIGKVLKDKMLPGYAREFSSRNKLCRIISLLYGSEITEEKGKEDKIIMIYNGKKVATWCDDGYGYLETKKGH